MTWAPVSGVTICILVTLTAFEVVRSLLFPCGYNLPDKVMPFAKLAAFWSAAA